MRQRAGLIFAVLLVLMMAGCGGHDDHGGSETATGVAEPAMDAMDADRTVEIDALDTLRFDPAEIDAKVGETITFVVTNGGDLEHEFVIGEHEDSMDTEMEASEGALVLDGGDSGEVTWTFTEAGELGFACYIDGHNASGMEGTIKISD